jgi:hypothetical protein
MGTTLPGGKAWRLIQLCTSIFVDVRALVTGVHVMMWMRPPGVDFARSWRRIHANVNICQRVHLLRMTTDKVTRLELNYGAVSPCPCRPNIRFPLHFVVASASSYGNQCSWLVRHMSVSHFKTRFCMSTSVHLCISALLLDYCTPSSLTDTHIVLKQLKLLILVNKYV